MANLKQGQQIRCNKDNYTIIKEIGKGNYGIVYEATQNSDGQIVAVKVPTDEHTAYDKTKKVFEKTYKEMLFLKQIAPHADQVHILPLLDWVDDPQNPIMVMPRCDKTIKYYCRSVGENHPFTCKEFIVWIKHLLIALVYLHHKIDCTIHRDIKADNILMKGKKLYLSDFGEKKDIEKQKLAQGTKSLGGTPRWGAPEQFIPDGLKENGDPNYILSDKVDIYPVALIMYTLIMDGGELPKAQLSIDLLLDPFRITREEIFEQFQKIGGMDPTERQRCLTELKKLAKPYPFPEEFAQACVNLMDQMFCPVIDQRINSKQALKQVKHLIALLQPKLTEFSVTCPDTVQIETNYILTIHAIGKGLPSIDKWVSIIDAQQNSIQIISINPSSQYDWNVTLPGIKKEGPFTLKIIPFDPTHTKICNIHVQISPDQLWDKQHYKDALLVYNHPSYAQWLNQIKIQANESESKQKNWLHVLNDVSRHVTLEHRPDLYIVIGELLKGNEPEHRVIKEMPLKINNKNNPEKIESKKIPLKKNRSEQKIKDKTLLKKLKSIMKYIFIIFMVQRSR